MLVLTWREDMAGTKSEQALFQNQPLGNSRRASAMDYELLAGRLALPAVLHWARYAADSPAAVERARLAVLPNEALFYSVQVAPEPCLYLFALSPDPALVLCHPDGLSRAYPA